MNISEITKSIYLIAGIAVCFAVLFLSRLELNAEQLPAVGATSKSQNINITSIIYNHAHEHSYWIFNQLIKALKN